MSLSRPANSFLILLANSAQTELCFTKLSSVTHYIALDAAVEEEVWYTYNMYEVETVRQASQASRKCTHDTKLAVEFKMSTQLLLLFLISTFLDLSV